MATKQNLVDRIEYVKSLIESKGSTFEYQLPKNYKKTDLFKIQTEAYNKYKTLNK